MTTDKLIKWSTVLAVAAVAVVAGWVSYVHALDVVTAHGEHGALAHIYPGTIDGLIYSASMVLLDAARRDVKAPALAYWLLAAGIAVTLVANVLAGVAFGALGAVVAAWPALALVGSYELLMIMIRRTAPGAASDTVAEVADDVPVAAPIPVPVQPIEAVSAVTAGPVTDAAADRAFDDVTTLHARGACRTVARKHAKRHTPEQRAERAFADHLEAGSLPSSSRHERPARGPAESAGCPGTPGQSHHGARCRSLNAYCGQSRMQSGAPALNHQVAS